MTYKECVISCLLKGGAWTIGQMEKEFRRQNRLEPTICGISWALWDLLRDSGYRGTIRQIEPGFYTAVSVAGLKYAAGKDPFFQLDTADAA